MLSSKIKILIYLRTYYNLVIKDVHLQLFVPLYYWRQLLIIMKIDRIVFLLLLDASKAFHGVQYVKFQTLRDRKICPTVLRLIMHMYVNQKILIRWNHLMSQTCAISNGVKQGGVLSPILYSVYVDNLIRILRDSKIGCMYNNKYMGIFTYADDISLLYPTLSGIQKMLHICEEYAFNYKITFNATKSQLLYFSYLGKDHSDLLSLAMKDGNVKPYVSKCVHLGTAIYTTLYRDNVIDVVNELYKRTNYLLSDLSVTDSCTVSNLFNSFCMNLYSCQTWRFNNKNI